MGLPLKSYQFGIVVVRSLLQGINTNIKIIALLCVLAVRTTLKKTMKTGIGSGKMLQNCAQTLTV